MCYHASIPGKPGIQEAFNYAKIVDEWETFYYHLSGFDHAKTPVITAEQPGNIQLYHWGLIPRWVKDEKQAMAIRIYTLNATCENVFEKPSYKLSIARKRCLVIVDGFFEWRDFKGKKYPYFIFLKNRKAFAIAGIYDQWINKDTGEVHNTYAILTCPANATLEKIHNKKKRMPVIVSKENEKRWLDTNLTREEIMQLMVPFDDELMACHTVSNLLSSRNQNSNTFAVQEAFLYPELPQL